MRVLTFNSFPGAPLPFIRNGELGIGQTTRLSRQMQALADLPDYDIACFQEIFSRKAVKAYIRSMRSRGMLPLHNGPRNGPVYISLLVLAFLFLSRNSPYRNCCAELLCCALAGLLIHAFEEFALFSFTILTHNVSGLMTFYNARRFCLVETHRITLPHQGSDFMNIFQPRECHIHVFYDTVSGLRFCVANTHLNALGPDSHKREQLEHIRRSLPASIPAFVCGDFNFELGGPASLVTWDPDNNPLCRGWMRNLPASQIDYILGFNGGRIESTRVYRCDNTSDHYLMLCSAAF